MVEAPSLGSAALTHTHTVQLMLLVLTFPHHRSLLQASVSPPKTSSWSLGTGHTKVDVPEQPMANKRMETRANFLGVESSEALRGIRPGPMAPSHTWNFMPCSLICACLLPYLPRSVLPWPWGLP